MTITLSGQGLEVFKMFMNHSAIYPDGMAKQLWYHGPKQADYFVDGVYELQQAVISAGHSPAEFMTSLNDKIEEYHALLYPDCQEEDEAA